MPVMDGLQAAKMIKRKFDEANQRITSNLNLTLAQLDF